MAPFTCAVCTEEYEGKHVRVEHDNEVCISCFKHLFELAIQDETEFPARWGGQILPYERYANILGPELMQQYAAKSTEYACPPHERVFCSRTDPPRRPDPCHDFVGRLVKNKTYEKCGKCMWYTCLRCTETFSIDIAGDAQVEIEHECDPKRLAFNGLDLSKMQRGKDYQICPNKKCGRLWALKDGCNHMTCPCRTHFCFICGQKVKDGNGHWRSTGGCPRWNQPDALNARYDDHDEWNDNHVLPPFDADQHWRIIGPGGDMLLHFNQLLDAGEIVELRGQIIRAIRERRLVPLQERPQIVNPRRPLEDGPFELIPAEEVLRGPEWQEEVRIRHDHRVRLVQADLVPNMLAPVHALRVPAAGHGAPFIYPGPENVNPLHRQRVDVINRFRRVPARPPVGDQNAAAGAGVLGQIRPINNADVDGAGQFRGVVYPAGIVRNNAAEIERRIVDEEVNRLGEVVPLNNAELEAVIADMEHNDLLLQIPRPDPDVPPRHRNRLQVWLRRVLNAARG